MPEISEKLARVNLKDRLEPATNGFGTDPTYSDASNSDSEIASLRERLARQQAMRRDLERELAESRSRQRDLERRLNGIQRTFTYRLGEALVAGRSIRGMFAMPGRFWKMWTDWLEKRRLDRLRPSNGSESRFAEHLIYVNDLLDVYQADGLTAACRAAAALPDVDGRRKARALVELAHVVLCDDLPAAVELAIRAASLSSGEHRLKAFAFSLFDRGEISAAARVLAAGADLEFHPGDLPRRQAISAFVNWSSGVELGEMRAKREGSGGVLLVDALVESRIGLRRRAETLAAEYGRRGLTVSLATPHSTTALEGVRALLLPATLASVHALDLLVQERAAALEALIASEDIGLLHAGADLVSMLAAAKAARETGCHLVLDIDALAAIRRQRGPAWDQSEGFRICSWLLTQAVAGADLLIARTPALGRALKQLTGRTPDAVLPDLARPTASARPYSIPGVAPNDEVVLLPRFSQAEPRLLTVVDAVAQVARSIPNVRLVPIGAGRDLGPLRQRAHDLGIKDRLIVAERARGAIEDLVARAQVLLLDDADTGLSGLSSPVGLAEARQLGVPVVAFTDAWAEDLIGERDAWLADAREPGQLAEHLASALRAGRSSPKLKRAKERGDEEAAAHQANFGSQLARLGF